MKNPCEQFEAEMYAVRSGSVQQGSNRLLDHLSVCPACADECQRIKAHDQHISQLIQTTPIPAELESQLLARAASPEMRKGRRNPPRQWVLVPLMPILLFAVFLALWPRVEAMRIRRDIATLISHPPQPGVTSGDRRQLLEWSAQKLGGSLDLPPQLHNVGFRAATFVRVASHRAVLLGMKNEERASLLVLNVSTKEPLQMDGMGVTGSDMRWSDSKRTYILLFRGNEQEMRSYAHQMGILT